MVFLDGQRKAGEGDLGEQLSTVTERCGWQEAIGLLFPTEQVCCFWVEWLQERKWDMGRAAK
jgi:hypothetical protein